MAIGSFEMVSMSEKVSLGWNDFQINLNSTLEAHLNSSDFTDVTLVSADGQQSAHRLVLSAGSPLLAKLLASLPPNPVLYFWDLQASLLSALVDFLYKGKVEVATSDLAAFLALAEKLKVRGLAGSVLKEEEQEPVSIAAGVNEEIQDVAEMKESEETTDKDESGMEKEIYGKTSKMRSSKLKSNLLSQYFQNDNINRSKVSCRLCTHVKVKPGKKWMRNHMEKMHTREWAAATLAEKVDKEKVENANATEPTFSAAEEELKSKTVPLPNWIAGKTGGKKRGRKADSKLWNFFRRSPNDMLVAFCIRCNKKVRRGKVGADLSKMCNSGMLAHLKSSHPQDVILLKKMREEGAKFIPVEAAVTESKKDSAKIEELWFYFNRLENGRAACQVGECLAELDGEDFELKEHLETHQPAFYLHQGGDD